MIYVRKSTDERSENRGCRGEAKGKGGEVGREKYGRWASAIRGEGSGTEHPFDELASGLASSTISRRRALQLAGASLVAAAVGTTGFSRVAQAAPTCPSSGAGCCSRCRNTDKVCACLHRQPDGLRVCVYRCCTKDPKAQIFCNSNQDCATQAQTNNDTTRYVCVGGSSCCGTRPSDKKGTCMPRCEDQGKPAAEICTNYTC